MKRTETADKWAADYGATVNKPPTDGTVLRTADGSPCRIDVEVTEGRSPFLYGRVFVPGVVGEKLGWFLQPATMEKAHGWKCILMPRAREECIRRFGLEQSVVSVKALKVIRESTSHNSLLCEVCEW